MSEEIATFEFDDAFQRKVAALAVRDPVFNRRVEGLIKPEYFENDAEAALVSVVGGYFASYKRVPDMSTLIHLIKRAFAEKTLRADLKESVRDRVRDLLKEDISDRDFVIDEVAKFARHQALAQAIVESVDLLEKRDFDRIGDIVRRASDVGAVRDLDAYDYFASVEDRTRIRIERASGKIRPDSVSTGIRALDRVLYREGWGRKELSVIMGAAKAGKTTALLDFSRRAALLGHNVFYGSLEVGADVIGDRLDAGLADVVMAEIGKHTKEIEDKVRAAAAKAGVFKIHEYPTGSLKPSDLRRVLERHRADGIRFDMITVDYADIMAPEVYTNEPRENSRTIYVALRGLAAEENAAVLTATQTNREGARATVAKMTDVAEDFNKIRIADVTISINATDEEKAMGEARLFFAASRNQRGNFSLRIKQNLERMQFVTRVLGEE